MKQIIVWFGQTIEYDDEKETIESVVDDLEQGVYGFMGPEYLKITDKDKKETLYDEEY